MRLKSVWTAPAKRPSGWGWGILWAAALTLTFCLLPAISSSASPSGFIKEVRVEGLSRLSPETVLYYVKIKPGDEYSTAVLTQQIRDLYALGFFEDIKAYTETEEDEVVLIFVFEERPLVDRIRVEGCDKVKPEKIKEKITVTLKEPLDKHKLAESTAAIKALYLERGFPHAAVTPELLRTSSSSVTVLFNVSERAKVKVSDIKFVGTISFSDFALKGRLKTRERFTKHPYSGSRFFFTGLGKFDADELERDRMRLEHFYKSNGYLEVKVEEPEVEYSEEREGLIITFRVSEGRTYKIGKTSIEGATIFPTDDLMEGLLHVALPGHMRFGVFRANERKLATGEDYSLAVEEAAIAAIRDIYASRGYIYCHIEATHDLHRQIGVVDVFISIEEGEQYRMGRLSFTGNTRTRDKVLRREVKIAEGDILNMTKLRTGIDKIRYLGYIQPELNPELNPDTEKKTADVNIDIEEGRLHEFRLTASYSKYQRFGIGGSVVEHNFLGYGQTFGITVHFSDRTKTYELNFDEPYFLDTEYSFGAGIYDHENEYQWYTREAAGGRLTFGKRLTDNIRISTTYRLENVRVSDIGDYRYRKNERDMHWDPDIDADDRTAPLRSDVFYEAETTLTSSDTVALRWDSRDNWIKPTRGLFALISGQFAGSFLGGDNDFYKLKFEAAHHYPLLERLIFTSKGSIEYGDGYNGDELPLFERYYLGGAMLGGRGFDTYEIGPKDYNGNSIGGNKSLLLTAELFYILADPLHVGVFFDAGQVYSEGEDYNLNNLRTSYGLELKIFVPMFVYPIRLVYGIKRRPFEGEDKSNFDFAIGIGN
ncbi:MAG: outer membrane protein assembly factor BamA [Candidatus Coatesbacteria bacterium]|nr:outer membrane protein assembly factor BamA [Candidatus Coatesbacteria bacterium]